MPGSSHNGGEHCAGCIITGETSLAHAGAIVNNEGSNFFVTHVAQSFLLMQRFPPPPPPIVLTSIALRPQRQQLDPPLPPSFPCPLDNAGMTLQQPIAAFFTIYGIRGRAGIQI
ncbi:hypothetical protein B566_EDAN009445 [Ephemera danica]|nr:hypothetical protein B566_EDAN009445 [Ephemera danica]